MNTAPRTNWREYITEVPWLEHKVRAKTIRQNADQFEPLKCCNCHKRYPLSKFPASGLIKAARNNHDTWCSQCRRVQRVKKIKKRAAKGNRKYCRMLNDMSGKRCKRVTPPWVDLQAIAAVYLLRDKLTQETGIEHHVDHIIPINGKKVTGLHVAANLCVIPATENIRRYRLYRKLVSGMRCCAWRASVYIGR